MKFESYCYIKKKQGIHNNDFYKWSIKYSDDKNKRTLLGTKRQFTRKTKNYRREFFFSSRY